MQKREQKGKLRNGLRYAFDSILQGSSRKHFDFDQQFGFFLFLL